MSSLLLTKSSKKRSASPVTVRSVRPSSLELSKRARRAAAEAKEAKQSTLPEPVSERDPDAEVLDRDELEVDITSMEQNDKKAAEDSDEDEYSEGGSADDDDGSDQVFDRSHALEAMEQRLARLGRSQQDIADDDSDHFIERSHALEAMEQRLKRLEMIQQDMAEMKQLMRLSLSQQKGQSEADDASERKELLDLEHKLQVAKKLRCDETLAFLPDENKNFESFFILPPEEEARIKRVLPHLPTKPKVAHSEWLKEKMTQLDDHQKKQVALMEKSFRAHHLQTRFIAHIHEQMMLSGQEVKEELKAAVSDALKFSVHECAKEVADLREYISKNACNVSQSFQPQFEAVLDDDDFLSKIAHRAKLEKEINTFRQRPVSSRGGDRGRAFNRRGSTFRRPQSSDHFRPRHDYSRSYTPFRGGRRRRGRGRGGRTNTDQ